MKPRRNSRRETRKSLGRTAILLVAGGLAIFFSAELARTLGSVIISRSAVIAEDAQIVSLNEKHAEKLRQIARLERDQGAIPEIHDRLHFAKANEVIVYLRPQDGESTPPP